jgi:hypothetical protein
MLGLGNKTAATKAGRRRVGDIMISVGLAMKLIPTRQTARFAALT